MTDSMFGSDSKEYLITLFEYAPISLWEQDFSQIKSLFDNLKKQGVTNFDSYLDSHPEFIDECMQAIKVLNVNQQTIAMFRADSKETFLSNLNLVFRDGMRHHFRDELLALWRGDIKWAGEGINYTLDGEALDIILHWRILPEHEKNWDKVLITIEDITARKRAEKRLESLFESSPISLWEEDYSEIKKYFDSLRTQGVTNFEDYLREHPEASLHCASLIRVLSVNQKTLELFGATSKENLLNNLGQVFRDEMGNSFAKELVDLWNGKLSYEREGINYSLTGEPINILLSFRVMPGHEDDFSWVGVAMQDITARKKAEEYLRYLGTHDVMTGLYNRAYFEETLLKIEANRQDPISIVIVDLNYLKHVNDTFGHQAGDKLIRRVAEVLQAASEDKYFTARIGGDEFITILPNANEEIANEFMKHLHVLVEMNNKFYREPELSISIGVATSTPDLSLEKVISLADDVMYKNKGEHHRRRKDDAKF
jgi:diguanylate cyclase (GGDEF)-like protein